MTDPRITAVPLGLLALAFVACLPATPGHACDTPVFRWALENWGARGPHECYGLTVFHKGPLAKSDAEAIEKLKKHAWPDGFSEQDGVLTNVLVNDVDVAGEMDDSSKALWEEQSAAKLPWMVLKLPAVTRVKAPVWTGPFSPQTVKDLVDSPVRRQIVQHILGGDAAVWLLVKCGDAKKDEAAEKLLESHLKKLSEFLEVPQPIDSYDEVGYWESAVQPSVPPNGDTAEPNTAQSNTAQSNTAQPNTAQPNTAQPEEPAVVHPSFSLLKISRKDPAEKFVLRILLDSESDLKEAVASEPVVFPVFGRGRALYALVGKGINEDNVAMACEYIVGRCSCEFKWMNPGMDLLTSANWDAVPSTPTLTATEVLQLVAPVTPPAEKTPEKITEKTPEKNPEKTPEGASPTTDARSSSEGAGPAAGAAPASDAADPSRAVLRNVGLMLGGLIVVIGAAAFILRRRASL